MLAPALDAVGCGRGGAGFAGPTLPRSFESAPEVLELGMLAEDAGPLHPPDALAVAAMNISTISGAIVRVQIISLRPASWSSSSIRSPDFPKEKEEVPKEDGSNKSESKIESIFFTPREKLEDVFLGVPNDFDVCWNSGIQIWSNTSSPVLPCRSTLLKSRSPQDQNGRRSCVLALLLSVAQMDWILGHIALIVSAYITYYTPSSSPTATAGRNPSTANRTTLVHARRPLLSWA
ncbi:uncharacterized protein LOC119273615 isoform X1 [Triticum dicoccoides]|uniref:uncharacterized protein LOC119273615 isoform X1 n=1 Tax=Triticum dicoccoides TaxID=85692 RepID=UPI00188F5F87|nr:uncharacterized protein LOC119273615 isoform X1 [Triticum dicoccoides]